MKPGYNETCAVLLLDGSPMISSALPHGPLPVITGVNVDIRRVFASKTLWKELKIVYSSNQLRVDARYLSPWASHYCPDDRSDVIVSPSLSLPSLDSQTRPSFIYASFQASCQKSSIMFQNGVQDMGGSWRISIASIAVAFLFLLQHLIPRIQRVLQHFRERVSFVVLHTVV